MPRLLAPVALSAVILVGCGSDPADMSAAVPTTAPATTSPVESTTTTVPVAPPGPPTLIAATPASLVALDLATGDVTVLAENLDLAAVLDAWWGRVSGMDLSPDGSTVAFTVNGEGDNRIGADNPVGSGLFEVPVDGSAPARRVPPGTDDAGFFTPQYSPDGRFIAVYRGARLVVLDEERVSTGDGVQMPYPPRQVTWTPDGGALVVVPHFERSACCPIATFPVDPVTGSVTSEASGDQVDGLPYFDSDGELRTVPEGLNTFDVDASGRFVVASDGTSPGLVWWDTTTGGEPQFRPLPISIRLQQAPEASMEIAW